MMIERLSPSKQTVSCSIVEDFFFPYHNICARSLISLSSFPPGLRANGIKMIQPISKYFANNSKRKNSYIETVFNFHF